jgi:hypothetical protein
VKYLEKKISAFLLLVKQFEKISISGGQDIITNSPTKARRAA